MGRSFDPLSEAEARSVGEQLARAHDFALALDPRAEGARPSLESLDRAFENYLAAGGEPSDADEVVQVVGAAFGARLVEALGFRWVVVTDEYGTGLAVLARPGRGDVTMFPAEFVAERYERREAPFLVSAFDEIRQRLREIAAEWGETARPQGCGIAESAEGPSAGKKPASTRADLEGMLRPEAARLSKCDDAAGRLIEPSPREGAWR